MIVSVAGALAVPGVAEAQTAAKVSIRAQEGGGFTGFVSSSNTDRCANGRKVTLYRQKGSKPNPAKDKKSGTDIAQANGPRYMWSIGTTAAGKYYARAGAKRGCKAANSRTVERVA